MDDKIVFDDLWMGGDFIDDLMPIEKEDGGRVIINRKFQTVYTQNHEIEYFISRSHFGYYFSYRHDKSTVVYNSRNAKPLFEILAGEKIDPVAPGILAIKDEETNAHRFVDDNCKPLFPEIQCTYVLRSVVGDSPFFATEEDGKRKTVLRDLNGKPIGEYKEVVNHFCGLAYAEPLE